LTTNFFGDDFAAFFDGPFNSCSHSKFSLTLSEGLQAVLDLLLGNGITDEVGPLWFLESMGPYFWGKFEIKPSFNLKRNLGGQHGQVESFWPSSEINARKQTHA
jgi:hypothetical protein